MRGGVSNKHCLLTFFIASFFFSNAVLIIVSEFSLAMIICQIDNVVIIVSVFSLAIIILQCFNYCFRVYFGNDYTAMSE